MHVLVNTLLYFNSLLPIFALPISRNKSTGMERKKKHCMLFLLTLLFNGCETHNNVPPVMLYQHSDIKYNAPKIQNTQEMLYSSGAINETHPVLFASRINSNSERVAVDWDGDAVELLSQLAHQRGLAFAYTGVRLPLPITIHVADITFESLLRIIRTQIDWRAKLDQQPVEMHLYFMLPMKHGA